MAKKKINKKHIRLAAYILSAFTFVWVAYDLIAGRLSGFFYYEIMHRFGHSAIVMMLLSSVTVLFKNYKVAEGWYPHQAFGLYGLLYATAHMVTFWASYGFDFGLILGAAQLQTFILFGNFAWIILFAIILTSIKKVRTSHHKLWRVVHYTFYAGMAAVIIHVAIAAKIVRPIVYFYAIFFVVFILLHLKPVRSLLLKKKK